MQISELKKELQSYGISTTTFLKKSEFVLALETAKKVRMTTTTVPLNQTKIY